jgi:hypothetical protein
MNTKSAKGKTAKRSAGKARAAARGGSNGKTDAGKQQIKDPFARYMYEHSGALGKDYKLEY